MLSGEHRLNGLTRSLRLGLPVVVVALLLLGTWKGQDDNFPFGPFRMYSTKQELDGHVRSLHLRGQSPDGQWQTVLFEEFGLRRADAEGQLGKLAVEPTVLLSRLSKSYRRLHGGEFPYVGLQLRETIYELRGGSPEAERFRIIATWRSSSRSREAHAGVGGRRG